MAGEACDIENEGTRKFLEEVDYTGDQDYVLSFADKYYKEYSATDEPRHLRQRARLRRLESPRRP